MSCCHKTQGYKTIHDFKNNSHFGWDNSLSPILEDFTKVNPVAGPLYIKDAMPGDTLEIEMLDFKQLDWGWTAIIPGFGLLADQFKDPKIKIFDLKDRNRAEFLHNIDIFIKPFPGTIGVALPEPGLHSIVPPRQNGGNMDIRHLVRGTKLYLPIWQEGALFKLHKGRTIQEPRYSIPGPPTPEADSQGYYVTTGYGPDIYEASKKAISYMIEHLSHAYGLSDEDAYMLCSIAVDLRINEIVDVPNWLVSAFLPNAIFR